MIHRALLKACACVGTGLLFLGLVGCIGGGGGSSSDTAPATSAVTQSNITLPSSVQVISAK